MQYACTLCVAQKHSKQCGKIRYMYINAVVTSRELKKRGDIWVCSDPNNVCTRFFFVYDESSSNNSQVAFDTRQSHCKKEINHAIEHIRSFKKSRKKT